MLEQLNRQPSKTCFSGNLFIPPSRKILFPNVLIWKRLPSSMSSLFQKGLVNFCGFHREFSIQWRFLTSLAKQGGGKKRKDFPREKCTSPLQSLGGAEGLVCNDTRRNCAVSNRKWVKNEQCGWRVKCRADGSNCESHCDNWQEQNLLSWHL